MIYYVRDLDQHQTKYGMFADIDDMPENWRIPCKLLDAASNETGNAQIIRIGHRMMYKNDVWFHLSKTFKYVFMEWHGQEFKAVVSNERDGSEVTLTTSHFSQHAGRALRSTPKVQVTVSSTPIDWNKLRLRMQAKQSKKP